MKLSVSIIAFIGALLGMVGIIWLNVGEIPQWARVLAIAGYAVNIICMIYIIIKIRRNQTHE